MPRSLIGSHPLEEAKCRCGKASNAIGYVAAGADVAGAFRANRFHDHEGASVPRAFFSERSEGRQKIGKILFPIPHFPDESTM
jgi:hypothetical protein